MGNISESKREWLLDKFSFEAKRTRRAENYKVWKEVNYIHNNPVRAVLVDFPEHYVYSSARDYAEEKGLVKVTAI